MSELTEILQSGNDGAVGASERVFNLVYAELRRIAAAKMAHEAPGQTLQATALVHEVWLRLSQQSQSEWKNREQFYAVAAETMRRILVDRARRRRSRKHGGDLERVHMDAVELPFADNDDLVLQVHDALERLVAEDPQKAQVVKLRFFVGLENADRPQWRRQTRSLHACPKCRKPDWSCLRKRHDQSRFPAGCNSRNTFANRQ